jgi:methionyl-tRNA formyltransferase
MEPPPVKKAALRLGLSVLQPERVNREEEVSLIDAARSDALVVVAYGAILKEKLLNLAPLGAINVHASLLPRHRGMAPIQRAVWEGDLETGITTMYMDRGIDTGDVILMERTSIGPDETGGELHDRLSVMGAAVLVETLDRIERGTAPRRPQEGHATYAARLDKSDGWIDWSLPADTVHNHARAVTPRPGATAFLRGRPVLVQRTERRPAPGDSSAPPGTFLGPDGEAMIVACGAGVIRIVRVKPSGRTGMSGADYARGQRLLPGDRFDARPAGEVA